MRITRDGGRITLRDRPALFWLLGLWLLAGGLVAVAMPLGLARNAGDLEPWERFASLAVGIGISAAAVWFLARSPATTVHLDLTRRRMRLVRVGLSGRLARELAFDELAGVEAARETDGDGDPVWVPAARLRSGEVVRLSELWSHDPAGVEKCLAAFAEACGLPRPKAAPAPSRSH